MAAKRSANTIRAYESAWRAFSRWCAQAGPNVRPLPAYKDTVEDFVTWSLSETNLRFETVQIRLNAIAHFHKESGYPTPIDASIRSLMLNEKRRRQEKPGGKAALTYDQLRKIALVLQDTQIEIRDRAMIMLAFASGWRRSEIVSLQSSHVLLHAQGLKLYLPKSKTDQEGEGRWVGIQAGKRALTCPVRNLEQWLKIRGTWDGPLFTRFTPGGHTLTREPMESRGQQLLAAVKKALEQIGEDPRRFGAHSLRAGMITVASEHGATEASIMQRTGHRSSQTLQRYIRPANVFAMNPLEAVL